MLNESIVRFSELQEFIEDFQMDVEDDGSIEKIFQTPYHLSVYKELEKNEANKILEMCIGIYRLYG